MSIPSPSVEGVQRLTLGVDPGTQRMGYAIVGEKGSHFVCLCSGSWAISRYTRAEEKLYAIQRNVQELLTTYSCKAIAFEDAFFGKNAQAMLKLGRVQGVIMATAEAHNLPVQAYAPTVLKKAITGNGHTEKEQVAHRTWLILGQSMQKKPTSSDESDALAIALCHLLRTDKPHNKVPH